jgi:sialic acid synthase SpsE
MKFIIEFGVNHLGKISLVKKLLDFFLKSSFKYCTIMLQSENFYKKNPNFHISLENMKNIISKVHKQNKKIGLAVCDEKSFKNFSTLNFDFYKLLSVANVNRKLSLLLIKKNKHIYISTGKTNDSLIRKSIKIFRNYKKITLLHTPITYKEHKLNFKTIQKFRSIYNCDVGYSNHSNNFNSLYALSYYDPSCIFLYAKHADKLKIQFPDNNHAIPIEDLEKIKLNYFKCLKCH